VTRGGVTEYKHYIPAGSSALALHARRTNATNATYYVTGDQLGSATAVMAAAGNRVANWSFSAFGSRRGSAWQDVPSNDDWNQITATTRRGFTGHEHLDNLSLVHMNGRVYDPKIGRFMSADPVYVGNLARPQSLNPYSYVTNNPLTFTDPSGFTVELCGDNRDCIDVIWRKPLSDITGADRRQYADAFGLFGRYAGWYEGMAIDNSLGTVLAAADRIGNAGGQLGAILRSMLMPGAGSPAQPVTPRPGSTPSSGSSNGPLAPEPSQDDSLRTDIDGGSLGGGLLLFQVGWARDDLGGGAGYIGFGIDVTVNSYLQLDIGAYTTITYQESGGAYLGLLQATASGGLQGGPSRSGLYWGETAWYRELNIGVGQSVGGSVSGRNDPFSIAVGSGRRGLGIGYMNAEGRITRWGYVTPPLHVP